MRPIFNRDGAVPRSVLILAFLLVIAAGALYLSRDGGETRDFTLGGPLFPVTADEVEGLMLTRGGAQLRLDRVGEEGWTLTGAAADYVDHLAAAKLVETLLQTFGGPILPGTEVEDRRYEFNAPGAIRLTVFVAGSDPLSMVIGASNPVGGNFFASGAGRTACFMVPAILRKTLAELPGSVQAKVLLPGVDPDRVAEVVVRRGGRDYQVKLRDGRWWLKTPVEGPAFLGEEVRDYQAVYGDRRQSDTEGSWILASRASVRKLIYEVSDIIVREIKSPAESADLAASLGLDPPWRQVTLIGPGLNPDPGAESPDRMVIAFGPAMNIDSVPALRRGNVLVTDLEALFVLEQPLGILAHRTALTFLALESDVVTLEREGRLLLEGTRTGTALTSEGRQAWLTKYPEPGVAGIREVDRHGFIRDVAVNLDRIPVLAVFPPTTDPTVLQDRERVKITVVFGTGDEARTETMEIGYLAEERLPAGSPSPVRVDGGMEPTGLWLPSSGKLLQIPGQFIVTARNLANLVPETPSD